MRNGRRLAACLLPALAVGCSQVEVEKRVEVPVPKPEVVDEAPVLKVEKKLESQPLKYLLGRNLKPLPTRPLNVRSRCSHKDEVGTRTRLDLLVKSGQVKTFSAQVSIPNRGICRFDLRNFKQTSTLPQAVLTAQDGSGCTVNLWEQENKVTVAFNSCPRSCDGDAFSYLWPIMVETKSGRCY